MPMKKLKTLVSCSCRSILISLTSPDIERLKIQRLTLICGKCGTEFQLGKKWEEGCGHQENPAFLQRWLGVLVATDHHRNLARKKFKKRRRSHE